MLFFVVAQISLNFGFPFPFETRIFNSKHKMNILLTRILFPLKIGKIKIPRTSIVSNVKYSSNPNKNKPSVEKIKPGVMHYMYAKEKFFENTFEDYSPANAGELIENDKVNLKSKIFASLEDKWQASLTRLQSLEYNDYTVYTGTAGVALLKLKKAPDDVKNLQEIMKLLQLDRIRNKRQTFLCGDAGPLAIGAVVSHKLNNPEITKQCVERISSMKNDVINVDSDLPNEYLYGRAGYLFAVLYVNKNVSPPPFDDKFIRKIIEAILICGKNFSKSGKFKSPLMYQWYDTLYLGAAHGLSGILYILLLEKNHLTEDELNNLIKPTIEYLITLKYPSGNYPAAIEKERDTLVQWCHGAPGFLYLFATAYKVFKDPKYLSLAEECGEVIWNRGLLKKGYSICHGVSGNGYCFLELYQTTQNDKHLYRALKFAEWCLDYTKDHEHHSPDRPFSMFEGICGPMYYLLDIKNPMDAKFPGFTP